MLDLQFAADHHPHHGVVIDGVAFERTDQVAVAQDDDTVGGLDHLIQTMGDEDHRDAVRLEAGDDLQELLGFRDWQT